MNLINMGRLTEYYAYLKAKPSEVKEVKQLFSHVTISDNDKKVRKQLKWYK